MLAGNPIEGDYVRMLCHSSSILCLLEGGCPSESGRYGCKQGGLQGCLQHLGSAVLGCCLPPRVCVCPELRVDAVLAAVDRIKASREGGQSQTRRSLCLKQAAPETLHSKSAKFFSKMNISKQKEAKGK